MFTYFHGLGTGVKNLGLAPSSLKLQRAGGVRLAVGEEGGRGPGGGRVKVRIVNSFFSFPLVTFASQY